MYVLAFKGTRRENIPSDCDSNLVICPYYDILSGQKEPLTILNSSQNYISGDGRTILILGLRCA